MQVDTSITTAASAMGDGEAGNVLFEPEIYRPIEIEENANEHMHDDEDDKRSVSTHAGINMSMASNYKTGLDPSMFAA